MSSAMKKDMKAERRKPEGVAPPAMGAPPSAPVVAPLRGPSGAHTGRMSQRDQQAKGKKSVD